jgi:hypothetical protein
MNFINPIFFWALAGLTIPLAIHLLSRKQGKVIKIGSIRYLQDSATSRFKSIRLNEIILLLIRTALITLLVIFLVGFQLSVTSNSPQKWVIVEPGLDENALLKQTLDSLIQQGYDLVYLQTGFPSIKNTYQNKTDYRQLVQELSKKNVSAIIFSYSYYQHYKGRQEALPENIRWITFSPAPTKFQLPVFHTKAQNKLLIRKGNTSETETSFENELTEMKNKTALIERPISIAIYASTTNLHDKQIMLAILQAIGETFPGMLIVKELNTLDTTENFDWLINLSNEPSKDIANRQLILKPHFSAELIKAVNESAWHLTSKLNEEMVMEHHLPLTLVHLLTSPYNISPYIQDLRSIPVELAWDPSSHTGINEQHTAVHSGDRWLIIVITLLLFVERTLAYYRNQ